ncbi:hypothetical protein SGFS_077970 [Streptomyces graminofaciens]|uniref:Uncharacterized protein n=1 Tax=Streptomyces graminofaciens TaxID=68212 RepID=A0ABM7FJ22_9ACTN|nr:hypothetical protein [Streptomyces graminofaciens]BBC36503.1 hypothetical protein SGFS_077970 [Streptomyces graminofaciens]
MHLEAHPGGRGELPDLGHEHRVRQGLGQYAALLPVQGDRVQPLRPAGESGLGALALAVGRGWPEPDRAVLLAGVALTTCCWRAWR